MIKRISLLMVAALMAAMMMVATAAPAFADAPPCSPGDPGCKTIEGKNPKFTQTQRGSTNAAGTENTQVCTKPCPKGQFK